jgi:hypothetical protein
VATIGGTYHRIFFVEDWVRDLRLLAAFIVLLSVADRFALPLRVSRRIIQDKLSGLLVSSALLARHLLLGEGGLSTMRIKVRELRVGGDLLQQRHARFDGVSPR